MARTKASVGAKISSGKSSKARCSVAPSASSGKSGSGDKASRSLGGGNPVCPRETPGWQRPITNFFINKDTSTSDDGAGTSDQTVKKKKKNVIESDDEDTTTDDKATTNGDKTTTDDVSAQSVNDNNSDVEISDKAINSDDDVKNDNSPKVNRILDETIELEDLKGDNSHKIDEYYKKNDKGKGVGKKSNKNKENVVNNKRDSLKRDLDGGEEQSSKRVKVK